MTLSRNKLYGLLFIACLAGYAWLFFDMIYLESANDSLEICLIKHTTGIPCPSCGSTRSVIALLQGDFLKSLQLNPLGLVVAMIMLVTPFWVLFDLATNKSALFSFYRRVEVILKKPGIAIFLSLLVIINWIWNISKGL